MDVKKTTVACALVAALAALSHPALARKTPRLQNDNLPITLERLLLPDAVADRIEGSGVVCRSLLSASGALHRLHVGFVRLNLTDRLAVRAGIGLSELSPTPLIPRDGGVVAASGVSLSMWQRDRFSLDVDVSALRAAYDRGGAVNDAVLMVAFRSN